MKIYAEVIVPIGNSVLPPMLRNTGKDTEHVVLIDTGHTIAKSEDLERYVCGEHGKEFDGMSVMAVSEKSRPQPVRADIQYKLGLPEESKAPEGEADEVPATPQR